jgi:hypothetical protein
MRYLQSYTFVFGSPNWTTNLLLASLCVLIPAVGPIILIGYLFEVIDALLGRRPWPPDSKTADRPTEAITAQLLATPTTAPPTHAEGYPDLTFDRLGEYLTRGIWPFLVQLIVNLPVGVVFGLLWTMGMMLVSIAAANNSGVIAAVIVVLLILVYLLVVLALGVVSAPLYIRAGLSSDFAGAFSMEFLRDFLKRVGKETLLMQLFLTATSLLLTLVGMLACCIGMYPAIALVVFAHHHLALQLYELYLERGGTPVEPKAARIIRAAPEEDL